LASQYIDRYIVSTEDDEISDISRSFGAEVLHRDEYLAGDLVSTGEVLKSIVDKMDNVHTVVVLQATSPIRTSDLIDNCIKQFKRENADSLATGYWTTCEAYGKEKGWDKPRQKKEKYFYDDGNVYVIKADLLRNHDRFGDHLSFYEVPSEISVDIDSKFDFWVAEQILTGFRYE